MLQKRLTARRLPLNRATALLCLFFVGIETGVRFSAAQAYPPGVPVADKVILRCDAGTIERTCTILKTETSLKELEHCWAPPLGTYCEVTINVLAQLPLNASKPADHILEGGKIFGGQLKPFGGMAERTAVAFRPLFYVYNGLGFENGKTMKDCFQDVGPIVRRGPTAADDAELLSAAESHTSQKIVFEWKEEEAGEYDRDTKVAAQAYVKIKEGSDCRFRILGRTELPANQEPTINARYVVAFAPNDKFHEPARAGALANLLCSVAAPLLLTFFTMLT